MANLFNNDPMILDGTMASTYKNTAAGTLLCTPLSIFPERIYWLNPSSSGDTFVFQDANGVTIFEGRCEASNQSQYFDVAPATKWLDFKLSTLASGKIELYYKT